MGTQLAVIRSRPAMRCAGVQPPAERPATATFCFALPPPLILRVEPGRWHPCIHKVRLDVGADGTVTIGGYDGLQSFAASLVMDQAVRFLESVARRTADLGAQAIPAELHLSGRPERPELYQIVLNARVAIAPRARWHVAPVLTG